MPIDTSKKTYSVPLKQYGWVLIMIWTLVAAGSLGWNLFQDREEDLRVARTIALTNLSATCSTAAGLRPTGEFMSR